MVSTKVTRKEDDVYITFHSELTEVSAVFPKSTSMVKFVEWCQEKFQGLPVEPEAPILVEVNTYHFQVREGRVHGLTMDSFLEATAEYAMDTDDTIETTAGDHSQQKYIRRNIHVHMHVSVPILSPADMCLT